MLPGEGDLPQDIELDHHQPDYQDISSQKISREECMRKLQTCKYKVAESSKVLFKKNSLLTNLSSGGRQPGQPGERPAGPGDDDEAGGRAGAEAQSAHQSDPGVH